MNPELTPTEPDNTWADAVEATNRLIAHADAFDLARQARQDQKPPAEFIIPVKAQALIDAKTEQFDREHDRLEAQAFQTSAALEKKLTGQGMIHPESDTNAEQPAARPDKKHARQVHQPKTSRSKTLRRSYSPRDKGAPEDVAQEVAEFRGER